MESLLRWGIENSSTDTYSNPAPAPRQDLDPAIIDMILGKSDADQMKEDIAVAQDESQSESVRVDALDHLEMLIEQIDNANNLEKLQMWTPLHNLITSPSSASEIKMQTLWVIGTALQNNPAAQDAYASHDPLPALTSFLNPSPSSTSQIRSKAIYALSGLLKHNGSAVAELSRPDVEGWDKLREALQDPDLGVRRKALFLLGTLIIPSTSTSSPNTTASQRTPIHANSHAATLANPTRTDTASPALQAFRTHGILDAVVAGLTQPVPSGADGDVVGSDADFEEKGVGLLRTYALACNQDFSASQKKALRTWIESERRSDPGVAAERWGLSSGESEALFQKVAA
ncbi:Fes1 domain-containing protein [Favolaschia claudopus]|uniref:Fes1 domain-containing protein n=1 Tax=Favolaschia claudopus TaxID=2862362 RepID=A0AAW0DS47_9AGAR